MSKIRQKAAVPTQCKICGAPAIYSYFGAISCEPCKAFFKRNAKLKKDMLKCYFNGNCEININTRHVCPYCRLNKCFDSGMEIELIRGSSLKKIRTKDKDKSIISIQQTTTIDMNRLHQVQRLPTLTLLQADHSTLPIHQQNLLSNLSHCYDEHSGLSSVQQYINQQLILPLKIRFKSSSVIEMIQMSYGGAQLLYHKNQDFLSLSENDRSVLLYRTMKYTAGLSSRFISSLVGLANYPAYLDAVSLITHSTVIEAAKRLGNHMHFDMMVMKLFLAILSFSTMGYTCYSNTQPMNLSNVKQVLSIQNEYIELTWKYLVHKNGYKEAIRCFCNFIRCIFAINEAIVASSDVEWYTDSMDSLTKRTKQTLSLNN